MDLLATIIIGGVCGWIGSKIMKSKGGLIRNIVIGIIGGFIGGIICRYVPFLNPTGFVGSIICGVLGSCILIWAGKKLFK